MKKVLLALFILIGLSVNAQFINTGGETFRSIYEFKFDRRYQPDTSINVMIRGRDTTGVGFLLLNARDTTSMFQIRDTAFLSTTARAWKFKPELPFKLSNSIPTNSILYKDTSGFINSTDYKYLEFTNNKLLAIFDSSNNYFTGLVSNERETRLYRQTPDSTTFVQINGDGIKFEYAFDSAGFLKTKYLFPLDTGSIGQSLVVATNDGNGNTTLEWANQILKASATLNFGSIGAHAYEDLTVTVTGASDGDVVSIGVPNAAAVADASYFAWVSAADTITIRCFNIDGGTINPPSALFKVKVFKD
jgi:hypothetical protein